MKTNMTDERESRAIGDDMMNAEKKTSALGATAVYESRDLFRGATEIGIEHDGAIYRLKITRQGKLILNK